ncbi:MAG: N-acetylmuramoyl-L-alanine amidase [Ruminococcaceae bacterium]|nr:N-acetylmuramoyl-L-alanine amidase [Oscillospiraceae bacterium]
MKKTIIIICCAVLGAALAAGAAFMLIKYGDKLFPTANEGSFTSEPEPVVSQPVDIPEVELTPTEYLTFTAPAYQSFSTNEATVTFKGNVKDGQELKLGNEVITCDELGNFEKTVNLKHGSNTIKFTVGEETKTFTVYRRYVIITSYTPSNAQTYSAGVKLNVSAKAIAGATVTAKFNGQTITLTEKADENGGHSNYTGFFTLPSGHFVDRNMGKVTFKGVHGGWSESFSSGIITCKKEDVVVDYDPDATPSGGNYINVGSGIIAEIVAFQAETFNGKDKEDKSRPYNNYLPEGTVDYSSATLRTVSGDSGYKHQLVTLRCGRQVYTSKRRSPYKDFTAVTKQYVGTLPDHNELSVASFSIEGHHTTLVLDTDWKAPFTLELKDQAYNSNFTVNNVTFNYVDITFCYATVFEGEIIIPEDHPLFKEVKIIKNEKTQDYTLRFILKKQGGFYGWDAYYNDQDQLCFKFLNPTKVVEAENEYGADLTGAVILIDVGHGGKTDTGSCSGKQTEKYWNLTLAKTIKAELESIGATVHITRTTDVEQLADYKVKMLKDLKPDYCIAIHHDGNTSTSLNGFGAYYYYPYSKAAAQIMLNHNSNLTVNGNKVYRNTTFKWHYYFMGRCGVCPVVLTENGYMTNKTDLNNITNMTVNTAKAKAITAGIAEYFLSIQ